MTQREWRFIYASWRMAVKRGEYPPVITVGKYARVYRALVIALRRDAVVDFRFVPAPRWLPL
jgi:hypothetical protein